MASSCDTNGGSGSGLGFAQEHFFKKYLVQKQLAEELHFLTRKDCCGYLGPPFRVSSEQEKLNPVPMLRFFFQNFVRKFPFIMMCSQEEQRAFWQDTVQPFVESLNLKHLSDSVERAENVTKRRQINQKLHSGLALFFNSILTSDKDMKYLASAHEKSGNASRLQKLNKPAKYVTGDFRADALSTKLHDYEKLTYVNDLSVNIVAVRRVDPAGKTFFKVPSFLNNAPKHHFEFILQVVERENLKFACHFVAHPYQDFKVLMKTLRKKYPGLVSTEFPELPKKLQYDEGVPAADVKNIDVDVGLDSVLHREKLRLALRGFLLQLIKYPEIVHSSEFQTFLQKDSFSSLDSVLEKDHNVRRQNEANMFQTQLEFQKQSAQVMAEFQIQFEDFKQQLIMSPNTLTKLFEEFGAAEKVEDLSPMTFTFVKWAKLEIAALKYQTFLSLDNSSEWLEKIKRFHSIFPYNIVYGILKFTNPMKMVARIIDLMLINIPSLSLSLPFSGRKDLSEASKTTGAKNLFSLMFVMLLNEDLNDYLAEVDEIKASVPAEFDVMLSRVDKYVVLDGDIVDMIKEESVKQDLDLLLAILGTDFIEPKVENHQLLKQVSDSYSHYSKLSGKSSSDNSQLYLKLKQYWLVQMRRKDSDILKQLWQEPELTQLIKKFVTIFYSPFVRVLGKADVHIMFRQWEKYLDENLEVLTELSNGGIYFMSSMEIFNRLLEVLDKHENFFYGVIHNLYVNDDEHVFQGLAQWIEKFLTALRIKFVDRPLVNIDIAGLVPNIPVDLHELRLQIDNIVEKTVEKRRIYREYLQRKSELHSASATDQEKLNDMWEKGNANVFGDGQAGDFGVDQDDLNDFNLAQEVEDAGKEVTTELDRQLHKSLHELEEKTQGSTAALDAHLTSFGESVTKILSDLDQSKYFSVQV